MFADNVYRPPQARSTHSIANLRKSTAPISVRSPKRRTVNVTSVSPAVTTESLKRKRTTPPGGVYTPPSRRAEEGREPSPTIASLPSNTQPATSLQLKQINSFIRDCRKSSESSGFNKLKLAQPATTTHATSSPLMNASSPSTVPAFPTTATIATQTTFSDQSHFPLASRDRPAGLSQTSGKPVARSAQFPHAAQPTPFLQELEDGDVPVDDFDFCDEPSPKRQKLKKPDALLYAPPGSDTSPQPLEKRKKASAALYSPPVGAFLSQPQDKPKKPDAPLYLPPSAGLVQPPPIQQERTRKPDAPLYTPPGVGFLQQQESENQKIRKPDAPLYMPPGAGLQMPMEKAKKPDAQLYTPPGTGQLHNTQQPTTGEAGDKRTVLRPTHKLNISQLSGSGGMTAINLDALARVIESTCRWNEWAESTGVLQDMMGNPTG
eukprot:TRINITY_DN34180_c0_g1_i1.p2 TRINITY_DN34180_c0_g1~~TRINITY_DN34180_c0_g1_i1.p2  ORF type:complete len:434 (-),score=62.63 TRINITY_DN34180_c0_g1_i1:1971-3272(-)